MRKEIVLVTGASSGIGLELARQFAEHGHPLVLTAPVENELLAIARELEQGHGVWVRTVAADLEASDAAERIFEERQARGERLIFS
jgi:short-subunit dehydrogenase